MFSCFFIVLFVETTDELFKDSPHCVVIKRREPLATVLIENRIRAKVDRIFQELFNHIT